MARYLRIGEQNIIRQMLSNTPEGENICNQLPSLQVEEMDDGGMGSLRFLPQSTSVKKRLGSILSETEISDIDGTPVSVAFIVDQEGRPFELDVCKVDFSSLKRLLGP